MHLIDVFWVVIPAHSQARFSIHWIDFGAVALLGGLWVAAFTWMLPGKALLPLHDPVLQEILEFQHEHDMEAQHDRTRH